MEEIHAGDHLLDSDDNRSLVAGHRPHRYWEVV
jgi:hypothetical protein